LQNNFIFVKTKLEEMLLY